MALTDFFRINMPYGIKKNEKGEWVAFNREYKPLGFNKFMEDHKFEDYPIFTKYKTLEKTLLKIADAGQVEYDESGKVSRLWLYKDKTNPANNPKYWDEYFKKIKLLSKLKVDRRSQLN